MRATYDFIASRVANGLVALRDVTATVSTPLRRLTRAVAKTTHLTSRRYF